MICKECQQETSATCNDMCPDCFNIAQAAWQAKMAVRMDTTGMSIDKLVALLFHSHWMHECQIIPDWMPRYPREDTRPKCVVVWRHPENGDEKFLRHSNGPLQGYSWDVYGDDMHYPELALYALSQSPPPARIDYVIPTHGR